MLEWHSQSQQLASGVYLTKLGNVAYLEFNSFSKTITEWGWITVLTLPEDARPSRYVYDSISSEDVDGYSGNFHDVWVRIFPTGEVEVNPGSKKIRSLFGKAIIPLT